MSYRRLRLLILASLLLLGAAADAKEHRLISTSSDKDDRVETFAIDVDDKGALTRLWQRETSRPAKVYTLAQLKKGVVLKVESDKEVIRFQAVEVDARKGGTFRMDYLYSGVPPEEWRSTSFELKLQNGSWKLYSPGSDRPLTGLHFKTNVASFLGVKKIVGIRAIDYQREN